MESIPEGGNQLMRGRDLLSSKELSKQEILEILDLAAEMKASPPGPLLRGRLLASCFFEPSTRTRLSFEAAMKRLGGDVIGFSDAESTSAKKGESLADSIQVIGSYADGIVLRHPRVGAAHEAADATATPVINAGDGSNEHPTQTLVDLFSIREAHGSLEGLKIALVGDLKQGRTVHSLLNALAHFNSQVFFVAPPSLALKDCCHTTLEEVIGEVDILYMTRLQKERASVGELEPLTLRHLEQAKDHLKILHPLPRQEEIDPAIDATRHAYYFEQAANGVFVRQALLSLILGGVA